MALARLDKILKLVQIQRMKVNVTGMYSPNLSSLRIPLHHYILQIDIVNTARTWH
jgi:hypothetical protein